MSVVDPLSKYIIGRTLLHGIWRGIANTVNHAVQKVTGSKLTANFARETVYYGSVLMTAWYFHSRWVSPEASANTSAWVKAEEEVGALLLADVLARMASYRANCSYERATQQWGWHEQSWMPRFWRITRDYAPCARYVFDDTRHYFKTDFLSLETLARVQLGAFTERLITVVGKQKVDTFLPLYWEHTRSSERELEPRHGPDQLGERHVRNGSTR